MERIITTIIPGLLSLLCAVISVRQFMRKGFVLNNTYLFASPKEREQLDTRPLYRQSGVCFALLSASLLFVSLGAAADSSLLLHGAFPFATAAAVYAVVSSIREAKNDR